MRIRGSMWNFAITTVCDILILYLKRGIPVSFLSLLVRKFWPLSSDSLSLASFVFLILPISPESNDNSPMNKTQVGRSLSLRGSLKSLEADIHHANSLADAVQRAYGGAGIQMKVSQNQWAPVFLYLLKLMDCGCFFTLPSHFSLFHILICKIYVEGESSVSTFERRASIREFYGIIYPLLQQLESSLCEKETGKEKVLSKEIAGRNQVNESKKVMLEKDWEIEDECDICMEICTKMVLPDCSHEMCINCYRDWYRKSESCPFCRGNLKRVRSRDLWVLTSDSDVIDRVSLDRENVNCFYRYIDSLPLVVPENLYVFYSDHYYLV